MTRTTTEDPVCGFEKRAHGHEWVCIRPPHDDDGEPIPQRSDMLPVPPNSRRHYFVAKGRE